MASALDVAKYLILLAENEGESDRLTHLRLQKLLYFVQGWSLAMRGVPMFPERIEAWAHGPVVRDLYSLLSPFGSRDISPDDLPYEAESLSQDDRTFIESVWNGYKDHSATSLRAMTHSDPPWYQARAGRSSGERCENEITAETLKEYFHSLPAA